MDFSKLSTGDKVVAGSGIVLFISIFLTWFKFDYGFGTITESGTDYFFTATFPAILGLVLIGYIFATKLSDSIKLPELPVEYPLAVLGVAGLAALLVILRLLIGGDDHGTDALDRAYGLYIGTLAAIGLAAGAFLKFKEDGGELPTKGGSTGGTTGDGGSATPF